MAVLKRNLWTLFTLLLLGGLVLLFAILFWRWQGIVAEERSYQTFRAELVAQSVDNVFRTQELVLDVVGRELLAQQNMLEESLQLPLLDNILAETPLLIGFGLARPDGKLVRVSSNLDLTKLPNLRTNPSTAETFNMALDSEAMVVGRTYFIDALNAWVIPIRKALRSDSGEVMAVMTAGIKLVNMDDTSTIFDNHLHDGADDSIRIFRERDGYMQFVSRLGADPSRYSQSQVPMEQRLVNRQRFTQELGLSVEQIKASDKPVVLTTFRDDERTLTAAVFNPRYQLWTISETRFAPLYRAFFTSLLLYILIYLAVALLFYKFFRLIDRSEKKRLNELFFLSRHDELTGLLNRNGLLDRLGDLIPAKQPFSLVVLNIDNFKGINDRYGLESGDQTLSEFGNRLANLLDPSDDLARIGGDEFAVLTPNTDQNAIEKACVSLRENLSESFNVGHFQVQVTTSMGVAIFPAHGDSLSTLLRSAHLALYEAKESRNSVCLYRSDMEMVYLRRLTVEQRLRQGLASGALFMMYQPQVDETGRTVGLEALVRWKDDELGFVSPAEFIEVAEKCGLMIPLGRFVLESCIREYCELRSELGYALDLAINISVIQFRQPDFVASVMSILEANGVSPREIVLEITETLFMNDFDRVVQTIEQLRALGIRISMDDFGTGYSSLSLLRKLPLDELKIDKSFVDGILDDPKAANMIQSIIAIAQSHNMELVAEGVEEAAQADALINMGCRRFQGYHFSRPQTLNTLQDEMKSRKTN